MLPRADIGRLPGRSTESSTLPGRKKLCKNCQKIDLEMSWDNTQGPFTIIEKKILHDVSYILRGALLACELCQVLTKITHLDPSKKEKDERRYLCAQSTSQFIYRLLPTDVPLVYVTNSKDTICRPRNFLLPAERTPGSTEEFVSGRAIPEAIQWQIVKDWLAFCLNNHKECCNRKKWTRILHLRLVDCWAQRIVAAGERDLEFVTLSYTWGNEDHDPAFGDGLPDNIPCTISDAMQAVKALGLRFLWVDRYCIPQRDCPEKMSLIQNMGKIYGASVLTLIAAAGRDPSYGLPGVGSTSRKAQKCIKFGTQSFAKISLDVVEDVKRSKWNSRAWTYQEALLSRRQLVFSDDGLLYQCGAMHCIEALSLPLNALHTEDKQHFVRSFEERFPSIFPTGGVGQSMNEMLKRIEEFTARDITHSRDTIDAFEGIFQAFASSIRHFHGVLLLAPGLFRPPLQKMSDRFCFGLGWKLRGPGCRRASFPSWTWAGWTLPAHMGTRHLHDLGTDTEQRYPAGVPSTYPADFSYHFALLDISVEFEDQVVLPLEQACDKYLQNRSFGNWPTYLHVTGMVSNMVIERIEEKPGEGDYRIVTFAGKDSWRHRLPGCEMQLPPNSPTTIPISALLYGHDDYSLQFILLVKVESGVYERVGMSPRIFYKDIGMKKRWSHNLELLSMEDYYFRKETIRFG